MNIKIEIMLNSIKSLLYILEYQLVHRREDQSLFKMWWWSASHEFESQELLFIFKEIILPRNKICKTFLKRAAFFATNIIHH